MSRALLCCLCLVVSPLSAGAPPWRVEGQGRLLRVRAGDCALHTPTVRADLDTASRTAWGLQVAGVRALDAPYAWDVFFGLQSGSRKPLTYANSVGGRGPLGAQVGFHPSFEVGAGLRATRSLWVYRGALALRREIASLEADGQRSSGATLRPWLQCQASRVWPQGQAGLYLALPLRRGSVDGVAYLADLDRLDRRGAAAQAHLPTFEVGLVLSRTW